MWNEWAAGQRSSYAKVIELVVSSVEQVLVECVSHKSSEGLSFQLRQTLQYLTLSSSLLCVLLGQVAVGFGVGG